MERFEDFPARILSNRSHPVIALCSRRCSDSKVMIRQAQYSRNSDRTSQQLDCLSKQLFRAVRLPKTFPQFPALGRYKRTCLRAKLILQVDLRIAALQEALGARCWGQAASGHRVRRGCVAQREASHWPSPNPIRRRKRRRTRAGCAFAQVTRQSDNKGRSVGRGVGVWQGPRCTGCFSSLLRHGAVSDSVVGA